MRVSDAEREHVGQLLQRAVGQGMLSLGEFTERMDTALAAKTRGELNAVLIDLPGLQLAHPDDRSYAPAPVAHASASNGDVDVIRGRMSTLTRKGPWHVSPVLRVNTRLSSVTLDFTEAVMRTQVIEIQVDDFASSITLVVPSEATADLNGIELVGASATSKVRTGPPIGPLHLVVRGRIRFGSITAKHPFGTSFRSMMGGWGHSGR